MNKLENKLIKNNKIQYTYILNLFLIHSLEIWILIIVVKVKMN